MQHPFSNLNNFFFPDSFTCNSNISFLKKFRHLRRIIKAKVWFGHNHTFKISLLLDILGSGILSDKWERRRTLSSAKYFFFFFRILIQYLAIGI